MSVRRCRRPTFSRSTQCAALNPEHKLGIISDAETGAREAVLLWGNETVFDVIVSSAEESIHISDARLLRMAMKRWGAKAGAAFFANDGVSSQFLTDSDLPGRFFQSTSGWSQLSRKVFPGLLRRYKSLSTIKFVVTASAVQTARAATTSETALLFADNHLVSVQE